MSAGNKNPNNVAGGLKATISNPKTSKEAKNAAREKLNDMDEVTSEVGVQEKLNNNVLGGYKATLSNDSASDEAKAKARDILNDPEQFEDPDYVPNDDDEEEEDSTAAYRNNVLGGYKATLKNLNASEDAKENAKEILDDNESF
ncbi:hypothetical protein D9758_000112 [Tetrapyrgos nigripes]|uniref:Uncharacterized protein n=1 Tax=Tetrapyrgos nigripes TaxID=182062 RepID=A0A8H5H0M6_9AGAR|nr:hypothetical protein D9758_000112 [Tetrapyrgos nigripes]